MKQPFVRPDVQAFLDVLAANPRPVFTAELLKMIRGMPVAESSMPDLPVGAIAVVQNFTMPGPGGAIALRLFDARAERAAGPAMVFFHGGGFVVGSIDTHAGLAAEIARQLDVPVISVEYRLAPENPWPAAPDDAEAAARWIAENGAALGRRFTGLILCGDSAGGNLAIVTSLALRDRPAALSVILLLALYPGTHADAPFESKTAFADGYGLEPANMELYRRHLNAEPGHWRASPLLADPTGMPPTLVATASLDPLRDEGRAYAAKSIGAGVPTSYREAVGTIHGFASYRRVIASAQADLTNILSAAAEMIRENVTASSR